MKIKGISFFEQHIEKFVLLGAVAIGVFFAAMQFLGSGNVIDIGGNPQGLAAAQVDAVLEQQAKDIRVRLNDNPGATVSPPPAPSVLNWFTSHLERTVSPTGDMLATLPYTQTFILRGAAKILDKPFIIPTFAAAGKPFITQYADALDGDALLAMPDAYKDDLVFATTGTTDLSFVTPAFLLDLKAIRTAYAETDETGVKLSIPSRWYDERIYILDVILERQELKADGQWAAAEEVRPFPDFTKHRDRVNGELAHGSDWMDSVKDWLRKEPGLNQASIIQPDFYVTKSFMWSPPETPRDDEQDPILQQILNLQSDIESLETQLAKVMEILNALGGPISDEERERNRGGRGGGGIGGGGIGGGGGGGGGGIGGGGIGGGGEGGGGGASDEERKTRRELRIRIRRTAEMRSIEGRLLPLRAELIALAEKHGINLNPAEQKQIPDLQMIDEVLVWGHDPFVTPGTTYRYRATVRLFNPFFGRQVFLIEEQKYLAKQPALDVKTTDWSEPVMVEGHTRFFFTDASPDQGRLNIGIAKVEIFRLYDGIWYKREWNVHPGDPLGETVRMLDKNGQPIQVNFDTDAFVLDILRSPVDEERPGMNQRVPGKVVVVRADGTTDVRFPAFDEANRQRHKLLSFTRSAERRADGS